NKGSSMVATSSAKLLAEFITFTCHLPGDRGGGGAQRRGPGPGGYGGTKSAFAGSGVGAGRLGAPVAVVSTARWPVQLHSPLRCRYRRACSGSTRRIRFSRSLGSGRFTSGAFGPSSSPDLCQGSRVIGR